MSFLSFGSSSVISLNLVCESCNFLLSFGRFPNFKVHPSSIMSFVSDYTMGMGGSDFEDSIWQPLVDCEVVPINDFSSEETRCEAFDGGSSSFERLVDLHCVGEGTSHPCRRVRPSAALLEGEHVLITTILPYYLG